MRCVGWANYRKDCGSANLPPLPLSYRLGEHNESPSNQNFAMCKMPAKALAYAHNCPTEIYAFYDSPTYEPRNCEVIFSVIRCGGCPQPMRLVL